MRVLGRFTAKLNSDRRFAAAFYGVLAVLWALLGIGEPGGWHLALRLFVVACFGFVCVTNLIQWRRDGRWVSPRRPIGPLSPALRSELQGLVDAGRAIEAIRRLREETGADLLTAKQTVDELDHTATTDSGSRGIS